MQYTIAIIALVLGAAAGYIWRKSWSTKQIGSLEEVAQRKIQEAEVKSKEIIVEAKDKAAQVLLEAKNEEKEQKQQLHALETRLIERESILDDRLKSASEEEKKARAKEEDLKKKEAELEALRNKEEEELKRITGLSAEEAKKALFEEVKSRASEELAKSMQFLEQERRDEIEKRSGEIITVALQRYARGHVSELTTTIFHLGDEDIKGKIIGREGRNIRALERATGVEFIIDEAPGAIVISSFDPFRREVARMSLEKLVKDGRIQPAKIEEAVEEAKEELNKRTMEIGDQAVAEVGIYDLPKEIIQLLGRLHFRTSFGQNVLTHSVEMAHIAGIMAAELGLNVTVSPRRALWFMTSARPSTTRSKAPMWTWV
jgi:ribonuclease Y